MFKQLWFRLSIVMMTVSAFSFLVIYSGFKLFNWAYDYVQDDFFPPEVNLKISDIEAEILPLQEEMDMLLEQSFSLESNLSLTSFPILIAFICVLIAGFIAVIISQKITQPIADAAKQIEGLVKGELGISPVRDYKFVGSEIVGLTHNINKLAIRLNERETRIRTDSAAIAHELRTPLAVMTSQLHALHDGVLEPNKQELSLMLQKANQLNNIIDDLRTLSLFDAGQITLNLTKTDLAALIKSNLDEWQTKFDAAGITLDTHLPQTFIMLDKDRFTQILQNILSNFMRYASEGKYLGLFLSVQGKSVTLKIIDKGEGLDLSNGSAVYFEAFYKSHKHAQSSGLGLAVVKSIIDAHKGSVELSSPMDGGLVITIKLGQISL